MAWVRAPGSTGTTSLAAYYSDSDSLQINFATDQTHVQHIAFKPDGTRMYTLGYDQSAGGTGGLKNIKQYELSTAFDVSTATTSPTAFLNPPNLRVSDPYYHKQILFNNDGTNFFVFAGSNSQNGGGWHIDRYEISVAWDITSTVTKLGTFQFAPYTGTAINSVAFNNDGTKLFASSNELLQSNRLSGNVYSSVREYTLTQPYDVTTLTYNSADTLTTAMAKPINGHDYHSLYPTYMTFKPDGTKFFAVVKDDTDYKLVEYSLSTPFDVSTASTTADLDDDTTYVVVDDRPTSQQWFGDFRVTFNTSGSKLFSSNSSYSSGSPTEIKIREYTVTTPFSVQSSSSSGAFEYDNTATAADTYPDSANGANVTISGGIRTYVKPVSGTVEQVYIKTRKVGETKERGEMSKTFYDNQNAKGIP
jgi:hypothetical protein